MRMLKNTVMMFGLLCTFGHYALAGDIKPGSVPGSLNYQGRLERDNAPVTGAIYLTFRIYNSLTGGDPASCGTGGACLWSSSEISVNAAQGIFSAPITPPLDIFATGAPLYLEVQVESDVLTPREPLNSVTYAMVAKKLEDGASVTVGSLTATGTLGLGTDATTDRLSVSGNIKLVGPSDQLCFSDHSCMNSAQVCTVVGDVTSSVDSIIEAGTSGTGKMVFKTGTVERMRINDTAHGGAIAIGPGAVLSPKGTVDIDGSLYVSNAGGIYDRDDAELNVKQDLVVEGGRIRGKGNNYISLGETSDTIIAATNNVPRLWLDASGNLGVGAAAAASEKIHSNGNIRSDTGLRGSAVSVGAYSGWTSLANEVRGQTDLLLQQSDSYNVGIGTATPKEKLHVHGSIRADYGVIAATAAFSGPVEVNGDFTIGTGAGYKATLPDTDIKGSLHVTGAIGSLLGDPAYLTINNTFTAPNTFLGQVTVSSDIVTINRVGVGVRDLDFPASKYLQIGDNKPEFASNDAAAYLVGGTDANSKIYFYRGAAEAAHLETQGGNNLALVVGNTKSLVDGTYYRVQNSVVWISTGYAGIPAVYVSSSVGNIGMGTTVLDPNHRLTVEGNVRISNSSSPGQNYGLIFPDGSKMTTANLGSASSISNNTDAIVQSDADSNGTGSVILRAGHIDGVVLNSGGNLGVGTLNPIGRMDVAGDLNISAAGVMRTAGIQRISSGGILTNTTWNGDAVTVPYGGTGAGSFASNGILFGNAGGALNATSAGTQYQVLRAGSGGVPAFGSVNLDQTAAVTGLLPSANGGTGANLGGSAAGAVPYFSAAGVMSGLAAGAANYLLQANGAGQPPSWTLSTDTAAVNSIVRRSSSGNFDGNTITAAAFNGPLTGVATSASKLTPGQAINGVNFDGTAAITVPVNSSNDSANPAIVYPLWTTVAGNTAARISTAKLSFVPNTGMLTAGGFIGDVTGNVSGSAATVTGAAQSAITSVGTLTGLTMGGTLVMGINNITMTGSLGASGARLTKGWFTDLDVSNLISGGVTGNAGTATKLATARAINGANFDGTAAITVPVNSADDTTYAVSVYPLWTTAAGNTAAKLSTTKLSFVPNTGILTATGFAGNLTGNISGNAATVTNGFYTTSSLAGDVTGTPGATVVTDDSHNHSNATITSLDAGKINTGTLPIARGGTGNATGNAATVTNGFYTTSSLAGDVTGTPGATVVGNDTHTHGPSTITGGASGSFDVAVSTTTPAQCKLLTVTNGIITAIGASHGCN